MRGVEFERGLLAALRHPVEVALGDQLQPHRDQAVVDLPLPLELGFVQVLLGSVYSICLKR